MLRESFRSIPISSFLGLVIHLMMSIIRPSAAVPADQSPDVKRIDAFVSQQMQRHGLPGLALALVVDDQVIFTKGYGKADQTGRPVTPQTPFLLASVSKPITAVAIMQLVETGQVELDSPVQRYVPDFRVADPAASSQITVRHLLLHTSGIPVTACDTRVDADTLAENVAELQPVSLDAPPDTQHIYCSGNYNVLGRMIQNVSGQAFGKYMQLHIFAPLAMNQSFTSEQKTHQAGMAQGYQWFFGIVVPTHYRYNPSQLPSGYMISSDEDMSHFLIAQLDEGRYANRSLLSAESTAAMQMPGTKSGEASSYGFGWVIAPVGDVPAVSHEGVNANFQAMLLMQPETRRGAVLLMNSFGIVPSLCAYKEIEAGVSRLLAGLEPSPEPGMSVGMLYLIIDVVLALLLAFALWPLLQIRRWYHRMMENQQAGRLSLVRPILRAVWEIGFALAFLMGIRLFVIETMGAQSWYEFFTAFPDFVAWIWAIALIVLVTGTVRLALSLNRSRMKTESSASAAAALETTEV